MALDPITSSASGDGRVVTALPRCTIYSPGLGLYFNSDRLRYTGGAESQTLQIACAAAERGTAVRLVTINISPGARSPHPAIELVSAWRSDVNVVRRFCGLICAVVSAPSPIYLRASRPRPDTALVVLLARLSRKRIVVGLASDLMCGRYRLASGAGMFSRIILKLSSQVIAQTNEQAELLRRNVDVRSAVIDNFVLGSRFSSARASNFEERDIDVAWVGSIDPRKRPETVLEIARQMPECRFAMIGGPLPGGDEYYTEIAYQAGTIANLEFAGFVEPGELPAWLGRARMLLHTAAQVRDNLTKEGFPNVFLEAWSSGIPVVSLNADPNQLLSQNGLGLLCRTDSEAMEQIELLAGSKLEWCKYRKRVLEYASSRDISANGVLDEMLTILADDGD